MACNRVAELTHLICVIQTQIDPAGYRAAVDNRPGRMHRPVQEHLTRQERFCMPSLVWLGNRQVLRPLRVICNRQNVVHIRELVRPQHQARCLEHTGE